VDGLNITCHVNGSLKLYFRIQVLRKKIYLGYDNVFSSMTYQRKVGKVVLPLLQESQVNSRRDTR
jgi:hypothetical protein